MYVSPDGYKGVIKASQQHRTDFCICNYPSEQNPFVITNMKYWILEFGKINERLRVCESSIKSKTKKKKYTNEIELNKKVIDEIDYY